MLTRLARACFRHHWATIGAWIALIFVLSGVGWGAVGPAFETDFSLPDSETKEVFDFLEKRSPEDNGFNAQIVFQAEGGVRDPAVRQPVEQLLARADDVKGVSVTSPYTPEGSFQISRDGTIGYAQMQMEGTNLSELQDTAKAIQRLGAAVEVPGLRIEYGGDAFYQFSMPASELLGILAAVVILLVAFGSVVAMGLPIATAVAGLFAGLALVALTSNTLSMPEFTPAMAAMIGLGVGIDYALFIVTRFREGLHEGRSAEDATVHAIDSSGRAVLFAGATVIVSLLGLFLAGLGFVQGLAVACIAAVLTMMFASVTLLPALISFAGERIEVTTWRGAVGLLVPVLLAIPAVIFEVWALLLAGLAIAAVVVIASFFVPKLRAHVPMRRQRSREQTFWYRWSRTVQRRPWPAFVVGLILLVALALPLFSIRLGFSDAGNYAEKETTRQAYDLLAKGFGPGFNGPLLVLARGKGQLDQQGVGRLVEQLSRTKDVAFVVPPRPLGADAALITVLPKGAPQDASTTDLVRRLRDDVFPTSDVRAQVGGFAAVNVDFAAYLADRLPFIIGSVLVLSFLLLMAVFRSVLVPLKAVVMNILSIGAAYGLAVAVFQWGWAKDLVGLDHSGPIDAWVPMMLFAIVFGLSMDYEVFLLSRMKEEYDRTGDNATAVADGLAVTARVITAAALIMFCVFASFVLGDDRQLKLFGFGLAAAVLLDATVVRMVLVPATMELLGARNWWLPRWLDRAIPRISVEGREPATAVAQP